MDVNRILKRMRTEGKLSYKAKGDLGEQAVLSICIERQRKNGGLLYSSYKYPYQHNSTGQTAGGNIVLVDGKFTDVTKDSYEDEIDILYITNYRIFVIEVKSYKAKIDIYDHWFKKNGSNVDKSPITQTEKHCRHLYQALWEYIPDGDPKYIVPIVVFVDKCTINDDRSEDMRKYIPVCILNNFKETINLYNMPLRYNLDLKSIKKKLEQLKVSVKGDYNA